MDDMTELMQSQWSSFIRTGKPHEDWPVYASPQRNTMIFDSEPRVVQAPCEASPSMGKLQHVGVGKRAPGTAFCPGLHNGCTGEQVGSEWPWRLPW